MKRLLTLVLLSLVAIATAAEPDTITVTGVGAVYEVPDSARVSMGVSAEREDVTEAMNEVNMKIAAITDAIVAQGIPANEVQTSYFNLWQNNWYDGDDSRITFYANHNLDVLVTNIDTLSDVIEAVIQAGATSIGGIEFVVSDPSDVRSEARALAMADAMKSAAELADLSGYSLGRIISVREGSSNMNAYDLVARYESGYNVELGQERIRVALEVVFEMQVKRE